jgi:hypothetical protein
VRHLARVDAPVELAAQAGVVPALGAPKVVAQARDRPLEEEAPGGPRGASAQAGEQGLPERREEDHQHACHALVVPKLARGAKAARAESLVLRAPGGAMLGHGLAHPRARGVCQHGRATLLARRTARPARGPRAARGRARARSVCCPARACPTPVVDRLVTELGREAPLELLGPTLARVRDAETYDVAGLLVLSSATYAEGLTRAFAHQRAWGDGERFRAARSADGHLELSFTHPSSSAEGRVAGAVLTECAFVELCDGLRWLVSPTSAPLACAVTHAPLGPGRPARRGPRLRGALRRERERAHPRPRRRRRAARRARVGLVDGPRALRRAHPRACAPSSKRPLARASREGARRRRPRARRRRWGRPRSTRSRASCR